MKTIITMLATILFTFTAFAADYTYSNHEPQIQRLQGVVLYPYEIEEIKTEDGIGYKYKLLRLEDTGQAIHQDRGQFAVENRRVIAEQLYDFTDLVEAQKGAELDSKISVDFAKPIKKLEVEEVKPLPTK